MPKVTISGNDIDTSKETMESLWEKATTKKGLEVLDTIEAGIIVSICGAWFWTVGTDQYLGLTPLDGDGTVIASRCDMEWKRTCVLEQFIGKPINELVEADIEEVYVG